MRTLQATPAEQARAAEAAIRSRCVIVMELLIANNPQVHYPAHDVRTMTIHGIATMDELRQQIDTGHLTIDCSQAVTLIAHVAGAKDPSGAHWSSDGYTGTLLRGCRHIGGAEVQPGDLCVFGGGTGHHVCMVMQVGEDPLLFSHGQESDPVAIRKSVESRYQPRGLTYLRLPT